jgi:hypothetical protein
MGRDGTKKERTITWNSDEMRLLETLGATDCRRMAWHCLGIAWEWPGNGLAALGFL